MRLISHRGNIDGKLQHMENKPEYILNALSKGFEVEVDVWYVGSKIYLGHDFPQYEIEENFLENEKIWCHAKNIECLSFLIENKKIHSFWHQNDDVTLTSKNYLWTFPGHTLMKNSICVLPETSNYNSEDVKNCQGVCSDYIINYI